MYGSIGGFAGRVWCDCFRSKAGTLAAIQRLEPKVKETAP